MKYLGLVLLSGLMSLGVANAKTTVLKNVSGTVQWIGYGVGKSHAGTLAIKSGEVTLDAKDQLKSAQFVIDMKSLDTKDSDKLKGHLKSPDFFDVDKFAEAHFKTTSVTYNGAQKNYNVKGDLTVKDKTHAIEFPITVSKNGSTYTGKASAEILDRTKYGINYNSKQFAAVSKLGDKLIQDNIKLEIEVTAK